MMNEAMLLEAIFFSLQSFEKIVRHATVFVCSKEIYELLDKPEFVLNKSVEIDSELIGYTSNAWYWL